ncbi:ADP-ribosylglycohydrolase family protein [Pseudonocardia nigra]|uniref:ADP-ribosylglycohydrolase family protein n=1 Tax=Pseudonocardia nigra TaxID=1921578 RepID=UPI0027E2E133|nr:ADP-ribosylglycohydrolase family protein [Pseudonocardia nigra]
MQPEDLVGHALAQAELDGIDVSAARGEWRGAGGADADPLGGASPERAPVPLRALALRLLDELDGSVSRYADREPTDLDAIRAAAPWPAPVPARGGDLLDRLHGGWLGRAAGCLLGKPVEKIPRRGIREILSAQGRWPLADWFTAAGLPDEVAQRWPWNRRSAPTSLAENIDGMPEDDDLNFAMLALGMLEEHGQALSTEDVAQRWLADLPAGRVFTAERVAYRNLLLGVEPPRTATRHNPFQQWIGAQIRADVYGWTHPGDPGRAAELAWRDAVLSHTGNGVYGALFVAAASAAACVTDDVDAVLDAGLSVVPAGSRYAEAVRFARELTERCADWEQVVDGIEARYGDLHWVHVLHNAAVVVAALRFGGGDFGRTICLTVSAGWDTDSTGATAGALAGAMCGARGLPDRWTGPLRNRVATSLPGFDGVGFDELAARTLALAEAGS